MDSSLKRISGNVIGDERILFGANKSLPRGQCCGESTAYAKQPNRIDLVIALDDSSGAVLDFNVMKQFAEELISRFVVSYNATRVAIVTWSTEPSLQFDFNKYINNEGVKVGIRNITHRGGWTATGDALHYIRTKLFNTSPSNAKKVLFMITNGGSNKQTYEPEDEAKLMRDNGVEIFAIGIGLFVHKSELKSIASLPTSRHKFLLKSPLHLKLVSKLIKGE